MPRSTERSRGKPARMRVWHPRAPALRKNNAIARSNDRGGQAPALRLSRPPPPHRRARACPSPCFGLLNNRGGQAPALRLWRQPSFYRRARACPSPCLAYSNDRGGQAPALRLWRPSSFHRRARACPSPCFGLLNARGGNPLGCACGIRGPPRYGKNNAIARSNDRGGQAPALRSSRPSSFHRRARACPSPCLGLRNDRGGQAPALRYSRNPTIAGETLSDARVASEGPALRYCIETRRSLLRYCIEAGEDDAAGGEELPFAS